MSLLICQEEGHLKVYWDPRACSDLSRSKKNYPKLGSKGNDCIHVLLVSFHCTGECICVWALLFSVWGPKTVILDVNLYIFVQ